MIDLTDEGLDLNTSTVIAQHLQERETLRTVLSE